MIATHFGLPEMNRNDFVEVIFILKLLNQK